MKTHYDILNLDKNCSAKEIKESFINLSKKYHPDINKCPSAHKKFVEVNEAYSVLGKPDQKLQYDRRLATEPKINHSYQPHKRTYGSSYYYGNIYYNESSYYYGNSYAKDFSHYGSSPLGKAPKLRPLVVCCLLVLTGLGIQLSAIISHRRTGSQEIARSLEESRRKMANLSHEERMAKFHRSLHSHYSNINIPKK